VPPAKVAVEKLKQGQRDHFGREVGHDLCRDIHGRAQPRRSAFESSKPRASGSVEQVNFGFCKLIFA